MPILLSSKQWTTSPYDSQLGKLADPTITVRSESKSQYSSLSELRNWVASFVTDQNDVNYLTNVLDEADSAARYRKSFWIDTCCAQGRMDAMVITKEECGKMTFLVGSAVIVLPKLTKKWQVITKKKNIFGKCKTREYDCSKPRVPTSNEVAIVADALRSNNQFGPAIKLAEA